MWRFTETVEECLCGNRPINRLGFLYKLSILPLMGNIFNATCFLVSVWLLFSPHDMFVSGPFKEPKKRRKEDDAPPPLTCRVAHEISGEHFFGGWILLNFSYVIISYSFKEIGRFILSVLNSVLSKQFVNCWLWSQSCHHNLLDQVHCFRNEMNLICNPTHLYSRHWIGIKQLFCLPYWMEGMGEVDITCVLNF
jgi:hypothetical protein